MATLFKGKSVIVSNNIVALQFQNLSIFLRPIFEFDVLGSQARARLYFLEICLIFVTDLDLETPFWVVDGHALH